MAERSRRRIERHLAEARLPPGKTLDTFDFEAVPVVSKARSWRWPPAMPGGQGRQFDSVRAPGTGKSHLAAALSFALVENGWPCCSPEPLTSSSGCKLPAANSLSKRHRQARQIPSADPRRPRLCHQGSGRNQRPVRAHRCPIRAAILADHRQPAVRRMGKDLPRPGDDAGRHRSLGPPRLDLRDERRELPPPHRLERKRDFS